jgi:hypothetical protein
VLRRSAILALTMLLSLAGAPGARAGDEGEGEGPASAGAAGAPVAGPADAEGLGEEAAAEEAAAEEAAAEEAAPPPAPHIIELGAPIEGPRRIVRPGDRTLRQELTIYGLLGGAAVALGAGAWFHLDSRDAAREVSRRNDRGIETWTPAHQAVHDRAGTSGVKAIVGYSLAAALAAGALVAWVWTEPADEVLVLRPRQAARPTLAPAAGGGLVVGGAWSW